MVVTPTYPGVYVQEIPSGVRTIAGVSTSVAIFIGRTRKGPLNQAIRLFSYTDFERTFSADTSVSTLPHHVRLFFLNGGSDCYVMRIANGATFAQTTLRDEDNATDVLTLTAKDPGAVGETVRAVVSYGGANPETTFNLDLFREEVDAGGRVSILDIENYKNLSMDPFSPLYAREVINASSRIAIASVPAALPAPAANGFSMSGVPVLYDSGNMASFLSQWAARLGTTAPNSRFNISVDGQRFIPVNLGTINVGAIPGGNEIDDLETAVEVAINQALAAAGLPSLSVTVEFAPAGEIPAAGAGAILDDGVTPADATSVLKITSNDPSNLGGVLIQSASSNDLAVPLALGAAQGGVEVSAYSAHRPAPNGISLRASDPTVLRQLADVLHNQITSITLDAFDASGAPTTVAVPVDLLAEGGAVASDPLWRNSEGGLRTILQRLADAINTYRNANPLTFFWAASLTGNRLTLTTSRGSANTVGSLLSAPTDISGLFNRNTRNYSLGAGALAGFQSPTPAVDVDGVATAPVTDGTAPQLTDYIDAFPLIDQQVDIFNLMILPDDADPGAVPLNQVYGPASVFCQQRRAFLIMDAPASWSSAQDASTKIAASRIGLVKDHSAIYFPRVVIPDGRKTVTIGSSGAVAGVYARIDSTRGVWKAPAGTEADIRGIVGLSQRLTDQEQGSLNPRGINVLRAFPVGLVVYGARTNDGDDDFGSEYKYIPVRRLALFIEESLYRGLKWVVFEPNDEPLYSQIRLNVGSFMHDLYRRGAFQGSKPSDAYFVKCDRETTTQSDRNNGIVNIIVGFAPLKPAEFVMLYLQQMAGQLQV